MFQELSEVLKRERGSVGRLVLILGSGIPLRPDRRSTAQRVEDAALDYMLDKYPALRELEGEAQRQAALERFSEEDVEPEQAARWLRPHFADLEIGEGFLRLAQIIREGHFSLIFYMGLDDLLERALEHEHLVPEEQYNRVVVGRHSRSEVTGAVNDSARLTVVKVLGDVADGVAAFTPKQVRTYIQRVAHVVHSTTSKTVIYVGYGPLDEHLVAAIPRSGDRIWWVSPRMPTDDRELLDTLKLEDPEQLEKHEYLPHVVELLRARASERYVISREDGEFDRFFSELYNRRVRHAPDVRKGIQRKRDLKLEPEGPYKFLDYYEPRDADIFFGREKEVEQLLSLLEDHRTVVLFGKSGVGKTSLINAGLIPPLTERGTIAVNVRLLDDPLSRIAEELTSHEFVQQCAVHVSAEEPLDALLHSVQEACQAPIVIFLDQFEEFFTRLGDRTRELFMGQLAKCLTDEKLDVRILFSVREDFFSELYELQPSIPWILHAVFRLKPLSRSAARQALVKPAAKFDVRLEEALVERILDDLYDDGIAPAALQIVCHRLYSTLEGRRRTIKLSTYEELGGAERILGQHMTYVLQQFTWRDRETARTVLKELVRSSKMKAPLPVEKICADLQVDRSRIERILWQLTDYRLVRRLGTERERQYELVHEYLVDEIESWMSSDEKAVKDVQDLLARELNNWRQFGLTMNLERLRVIDTHRAQIQVTPEELELILRSCIEQDFELDYWFGRIAELEERELDFLRHILRTAKVDVQLRAVERLAELGTPEAVDVLLSALGSARGRVARAIAQVLERHDREIAASLREGPLEVRRRAAVALGHIGSDVAVRALVQALDEETLPDELRETIIEAMRRIGHAGARRAASELIHSLVARNGRLTPAARWARARALAASSVWQEAREQLLRAAAHHPEVAEIRYALAEAHMRQREVAEAREQLLALRTAQEPHVSAAVEELERAVQRIEMQLAQGYFEWAMFRKNAQHTGATPEVIRPPLARRWVVRTEGHVMSSPCVSRGVVYAGSRDGFLRALDIRSGEQRWAYQTGARIESSPAVCEDVVVVACQDGTIHAVHAQTGRLLWKTRLRSDLLASPTIAEGWVYLGAWDGHMYCFSLEDGKQRWRYRAGREIYSSAAVCDGLVVFGCWDRSLHVVSARRGRREFRFETGGEISSSPAVVEGLAFFGSDDGNVYCVSLADGKLRWRYQTGGHVRASPAVRNGHVYVGSSDKHFYALDAQTGEEEFSVATGEAVYSSAAAATGAILFGSRDGALYCVDPVTGEVTWRDETAYSVSSSPAVADSMVIVGMDYYNVVAYEPQRRNNSS